jgi:ssDNA-binding replication factor A large subunit
LVRIKNIIGEHEDNRNYGVQRIQLALSQIEITSNYSTVYRIMKKHGLLKKVRRLPNGITREEAAAQKSVNLIHRDFSLDNEALFDSRKSSTMDDLGKLLEDQFLTMLAYVAE